MTSRRRYLTPLALAALYAIRLPILSADTAQWLNPADGQWSDPTNWSTNPIYPNDPSVDVLLAANGIYTAQLQTPGTLTLANSVTIGSSGSTLQLLSPLQTPLLDVQAGVVSISSELSNARIQGMGQVLANNLSTLTDTTLATNLAATGQVTLNDSFALYSGTLSFEGTLIAMTPSITGTGLIESNATVSSTTNFLNMSGTSLSFGPNVTLRTGSASLQINATVSGTSLVNQGSMIAHGAGLTLTISGASFTNQGLVQADPSTVLTFSNPITNNGQIIDNGGTLNLPGLNSPSTGTIQLTNAVANLGGYYTSSNFATISNSAINSGGAFDLEGTALTLQNSTWTQIGGMIINGSILGSGSSSLIFTSETIVQNVTIGIPTQITGGPMILGGTINFAGTSVSILAPLVGIRSNPTSLAFAFTGTGEIVFNSTATGTNGITRIDSGYSIDVLIDRGITIRTGINSGELGFGGCTVTNLGLISAQTPGHSITLSYGSLDQQGTLEAKNGSTLQISAQPEAGNESFTNSGTLTANGGYLKISSVVYNCNLGGTLLASNGGTLNFSTGIFNISAPIILQNGNCMITAGGNISAVTGPGTFQILNTPLASDGLNVSTLVVNTKETVRPNGGAQGASMVSSLSIAGAFNAWTGTFDLNDNVLVLQNSSTTSKAAALSTLQNQITSGKNGGAWGGTGITSSTVAIDQSATGSHLTTLAIVDNGELGATSFRGESGLDSNSLIVAQALWGDVDLSGSVGFADLLKVAQDFGQTGGWAAGNMEGPDNGGTSATVDFGDLLLVAQHFGQTLPVAVGGASTVPVPEPGGLAMLVLAGLPGVMRRWRRRDKVTR